MLKLICLEKNSKVLYCHTARFWYIYWVQRHLGCFWVSMYKWYCCKTLCAALSLNSWNLQFVWSDYILLWKKLSNFLPKCLCYFAISSKVNECCCCSASLSAFGSASVVNFGHSNLCREVVCPFCITKVIVLMIYLLLNQIGCLYIVGFSFKFWMEVWIRYVFCKYLSQAAAYIFHLLIFVFCREVFNFNEVHLINLFSFISLPLVLYFFKSHCKIPGQLDVFLLFSRSFIVLHFHVGLWSSLNENIFAFWCPDVPVSFI